MPNVIRAVLEVISGMCLLPLLWLLSDDKRRMDIWLIAISAIGLVGFLLSLDSQGRMWLAFVFGGVALAGTCCYWLERHKTEDSTAKARIARLGVLYAFFAVGLIGIGVDWLHLSHRQRTYAYVNGEHAVVLEPFLWTNLALPVMGMILVGYGIVSAVKKRLPHAILAVSGVVVLWLISVDVYMYARPFGSDEWKSWQHVQHYALRAFQAILVVNLIM